MKYCMVMARITLCRKTGGQDEQSKSDPANRSVRIRHKRISGVQPHSILGQSEDNWEGASWVLLMPLLSDSYVSLEDEVRRVLSMRCS